MQPEGARVGVVIHLRLLPVVVVVINATVVVVVVVAVASVEHVSVLLASQLQFLLRFALVARNRRH